MTLMVGAAVVALGSCSLFDFLDTIEVQVDGSAVSSYDFGYVTSTPVSVTVNLVNKGSFPLHLGGLSAVSVSGTNADDFSISGNPSDVIEAGASVSFVLTFDPAYINETRTATVTISPAGGAPDVTLSVSGYVYLT